MVKNVKNCDLVVLGAGGAGLLAAVKAKDLGVKNVIILEKAKNPGGWTIDKPMPAIRSGFWMVSSGYLAGIAAAKYLGKA